MRAGKSIMRYVGAALLLSVSLPAHVQAQAQVPELYLDELNEVTVELRDSIALVAPMSSDERRSAVDIQMSLYRSSESLRRIERYTRSQNNDLVRLGNAPNRALLRSAALAVQLDAAQQMLALYLELGDRIFLDNARASLKMAMDLKALR